MAFNTWWTNILLGSVAACALAAWLPFCLAPQHSITERAVDASSPRFDPTGQIEACVALAVALPDSVYSDHHPTFHKSITSYWSLNAREIQPACFIRPTSVQDVSAAIKVLKLGFDTTKNSTAPLKFAVRSGGHSPEGRFASVDGGIVIDMGLMNEISVTGDKQTASLGVGARWIDVSSELDGMGLAVVGGRNSNVGVGGLVLGGGISFFSPRYGMVCDNVVEYEIVLADGTITMVTASQHEDLWRALKGGTGNFGIVTRVTARTFAASNIWAGYAFWTGWQAPKVLKVFAEFNKPEHFDEYAAGPIVALGYVQKLNVKVVASSLAYTKPEKWAPVFEEFNRLWRLWSTTKVQSLSDATRELDRMSPSGLRQFQVTTTVRNDLDTFTALNDIYNEKLKEVRGVKGAVWSLVFQPLSAAVTHKGSPNVLGLETRHANDTLVIVLVSVSWPNAHDDELVHRVSRDIITLCDNVAQRKGTADPYRYLNYAASGQDPFSGYGAANKAFLQAVSKAYDPDGFFQLAKQGGFKLDLSYDAGTDETRKKDNRDSCERPPG